MKIKTSQNSEFVIFKPNNKHANDKENKEFVVFKPNMLNSIPIKTKSYIKNVNNKGEDFEIKYKENN